MWTSQCKNDPNRTHAKMAGPQVVSRIQALRGIRFLQTLFGILLVSSLVSSLTTTANAQITISGEVSGNLLDTVYVVTDDVTVSSSLHIPAGAELRFENSSGIIVYSLLEVEGTRDDTVVFAPLNEGETWSGIRFISDSHSSSYIVYSKLSAAAPWAIYCEDWTEVSLQNLTIQDCPDSSGGGILWTSHFPDPIRDCVISGNAGSGIVIHEDATTALIDHCWVSGNGNSGIVVNGIASTIQNSFIFNNHAENGGGISVPGSGDVDILWTVVAGNTASGAGGGIFSAGSTDLDHCTIAGNQASYAGSGFTDFHGGSDITNTIVASNVGQYQIYMDVGADILFSAIYGDHPFNPSEFAYDPGFGEIDRTNLNGDSCDTYNNLFLDPLFMNPENQDYRLMEPSPCINAGDPEYPLDSDGSVSEIGSYPYLTDSVNAEYVNLPDIFDITCYPNPTNAFVNIRNNSKYDIVNIKLFDLLGRECNIRTNSYSMTGRTISVNMESLPSGSYFLSVHSKHHETTKKIYLLR